MSLVSSTTRQKWPLKEYAAGKGLYCGLMEVHEIQTRNGSVRNSSPFRQAITGCSATGSYKTTTLISMFNSPISPNNQALEVNYTSDFSFRCQETGIATALAPLNQFL